MQTLLVLQGLPASGKSTYAKEKVKEGFKRVNKDDIRAMVDDNHWNKDKEKVTIATERSLAESFLQQGFNVVVDDTNFAEKHLEYYKQLAAKYKADYQIKVFDTPMTECIERDAKRGDKSVGARVIQGMWETYLKPEKIKKDYILDDCFIFDIDGTLAHMENRSPFEFDKVDKDMVDLHVKYLFQILEHNAKIIVFSGRDSICREATEQWLHANNIVPHGLYMRAEGDNRKDSIIKKELYENHIKGKYNVMGVFDDRNQVVNMWRDLGLTCYQVAYGYF